MQDTSELYQKIYENPKHLTETRLDIAGVSYTDKDLISVKTEAGIFRDGPEPGGVVSRTIDVEMKAPTQEIPRAAEMRLWIRLTLGAEHSEWIPKGIYYIDTRREDSDGRLRIKGFCGIMKTEADCPIGNHDWPATDISVVRDIAAGMGAQVDARTVAAMDAAFPIQMPAGYSGREVLSGIAAMYGGSFIMSDSGQLLLIQLDGLPEPTNYLITEHGNAILFGGVRILV